MKKIEELNIGDLMTLQNIISSYGKDENKLYEEIVRFIYGNTEVSKKEADLTIMKVTALINNECELNLNFEYNGVEYGFIPNLDEMSTAEYVDLDTYMKEGTQFHKIMAILYRPIVKPKWYLRWLKYFYKDAYIIEKYEGTSKYSEEMKGVNHKIYLGAKVFFYHLEKSLLEISDIYTQSMITKMLKKKKISN